MSERNRLIESALTDEWQDATAIASAVGMEMRYGMKASMYHALEQAVKEGRAQRRRVWPSGRPKPISQWRRMPS